MKNESCQVMKCSHFFRRQSRKPHTLQKPTHTHTNTPSSSSPTHARARDTHRRREWRHGDTEALTLKWRNAVKTYFLKVGRAHVPQDKSLKVSSCGSPVPPQQTLTSLCSSVPPQQPLTSLCSSVPPPQTLTSLCSSVPHKAARFQHPVVGL